MRTKSPPSRFELLLAMKSTGVPARLVNSTGFSLHDLVRVKLDVLVAL